MNVKKYKVGLLIGVENDEEGKLMEKNIVNHFEVESCKYRTFEIENEVKFRFVSIRTTSEVKKKIKKKYKGHRFA